MRAAPLPRDINNSSNHVMASMANDVAYVLGALASRGMEVVKMCEKCNVQVDDMIRQIGQCLRRLQHARVLDEIGRSETVESFSQSVSATDVTCSLHQDMLSLQTSRLAFAFQGVVWHSMVFAV